MRVRTLVLAVTLGLVALSGCQKLNHEQTISMPGHSTKALLFDAPRYNQKVTVTVKPTGGGPVSACLCKADSHEKAENRLMMEKEPDSDAVFGSAKAKAADEEITFDATVPKGTDFALVLYNSGKNADVSVKVIGR